MNIVIIIVGILLVIALYDVFQKRHSLLRAFPIIGHFRYLIESIGPEIRQYLILNNNEERPFDRDQRTWVYASSKGELDYFGFGSDNDLERTPNYIIIKQSAFPLSEALPGEPNYDPSYQIPCGKILGEWRKRPKAFRPSSVINISGMSYGSLSPAAVEALNRGAKLANCLHNTGEGGIAPAHRHGGELVWQIGSGYFGCRDANGDFSLAHFKDTLASADVRAIEIKLSQGAKPGLGGVLPAPKVTPHIANIRGVQPYMDCISPAGHSAFEDVDSLLDFVEMLADETGLPVGIKSAVGHINFWRVLARRIAETGRSVDFITIDGGEGGTGAAPLVFSDNVSLPFKMAMARIYREFVPYNIHDKIVFIGSGKLGFPEAAIFAFALGCDMINIGREAMLSIGCIQAQKCHTNRCPVGITTQSKWLTRALDPTLKSVRFANYVTVLRKEILRLSRACGVVHPTLLSSDHLEIINDHFQGESVSKLFQFNDCWGLPSKEERETIERLMANPQNLRRHPDAPKVKNSPTVPHGPTNGHDTKSGISREKI